MSIFLLILRNVIQEMSYIMVNYLNNPIFYFFAKTNEIYFKKFETINNYIKNNNLHESYPVIIINEGVVNEY